MEGIDGTRRIILFCAGANLGAWLALAIYLGRWARGIQTRASSAMVALSLVHLALAAVFLCWCLIVGE